MKTEEIQTPNTITETGTQIKEDSMTAANTNPTEAPNTDPQIINVPMDKLAVPTSHPRRRDSGVRSLQESIENNNLLEPLTVCKSDQDEFYMVVDGTRRLVVLAKLGWKSVPCVVMPPMNLGQIAHASFVKNMERESLDPIEIALHLKAMKTKYGYSLRDLEMKGYGSPATISNRIKLLKLPEYIKYQLSSGSLPVAHGLVLLKLETADEQRNWARRMLEEELSASRAEKMITK